MRAAPSHRPACRGATWSVPLLLVGCLLWGTPGRAESAPASRDSELLRVREQIAAVRERVSAHEQHERDLLALLEDLDRGHEALRELVAEANERARRARVALAEVEPRLARVREELQRTRRDMSRRAVALYKAGEVGPVRVLFSAQSLPDLLSRAAVLERLLRYDADLVAGFVEQQDRLRAVEVEAERAAEVRREAIARLSARSADLERERATKRSLLASVRNDRSRERALLIELEQAARALEETLAGIERDGVHVFEGPAAHFAERRGALGRPVPGEIARPFGRVVDAEYQTETFRKGVEFAADLGDRVRAVARGRVRYAGWFRGYGKIVILDHGEGYFTVSGHLADIFVEVGDLVSEGDTLGSVGDTGSLSGPGLYFEIRAGGSPLDPKEWLGKS